MRARWYVSHARAMMHNDAYQARALALAQDLLTVQHLQRTNRQAQAQTRSHYVVTLHREESADASI